MGSPTSPLGRPLLRGGGEVRVDLGKYQAVCHRGRGSSPEDEASSDNLGPGGAGLIGLCPQGWVLAEQLVGGVLVRRVLPDLGHFAVADVEHQRVVVIKRFARPLGMDRVEANRVLVVGDNIVDLHP
jgi:hypothetical protein